MSLMSNTCVLGTMQKQTGLFWALVKHAASPRRLFAIFPPQRLFTQSVIHKRGRGKNSDCFTVAMHMCENITGVCELGKKEKKKKKRKTECSRSCAAGKQYESIPDADPRLIGFLKQKNQGENKIPTTAGSNEYKPRKHFCGPLESELGVLTSDWICLSCRIAHRFQLEKSGLRSIYNENGRVLQTSCCSSPSLFHCTVLMKNGGLDWLRQAASVGLTSCWISERVFVQQDLIVLLWVSHLYGLRQSLLVDDQS